MKEDNAQGHGCGFFKWYFSFLPRAPSLEPRAAIASNVSMRLPWFTVGVLVLVTGCVRTHFNLATQRQEYTLTSTEREVTMGRKIAQKVEEELPILGDPEVEERVNAIGARLVAVCDRQDIPYTFNVIDKEDVNAFALPGGFVYVYRGLLDEMANDDELAAVIAHEVAHIAARHSIKRYETGLGLQLAQLATLATRQAEAAQGINVAMQAARLAYAREDELNADRLGVQYMQKAGFDATAILDVLETMDALDRKKPAYLPRGVVRPQYASTHPFIPSRTLAVKEILFGVGDYLDYINTAE